ncbi:DUF11 domain-containing protein [Methylotetracoccus oryzae]|uniref:DUF11 domain-containing protein n=1 Tax=Methylotetracoccus oryzae TaxID=1919059 RepID=UPI001119C752|nr:DUF11 domain-containing protein [Methylotetracoccus oryzae]
MSFALAAAGMWSLSQSARAIGETTMVSVNSKGEQGKKSSSEQDISADGRFVAFTSTSKNLVAGDANGDFADVFVHDRRNGVTRRVSVDSHGVQSLGESHHPSISSNGRHVAFVSYGFSSPFAGLEVSVHDWKTGMTERVDLDSAGNLPDLCAVYCWVEPALSGNGRFVAFPSNATNLVAGDTNGAWDIFVRDRTTRQTTRISVDSAGKQGDQPPSYYPPSRPALSADGRFVAFVSDATNLVAGDTNGTWDVFVHDRKTHQTIRVSVDSVGRQGNDDSAGGLAISLDGRYVAFTSYASNLVPGDTNGQPDVFVHDRQTRETTRVSVDSMGREADSWSGILGSSLSADGRFVGFSSNANNLVVNTPPSVYGTQRTYIHDRLTHETSLVSVDASGNPANEFSRTPELSANGRFAAFSSGATNLVSVPDSNGFGDVFVRDRLLDRTATADIAVLQTMSPSPPIPDSAMTYTMAVTNHGPDPASEVTLVDGMLRGTAVPSQGTCSAGTPKVCYLGSLAPGASATVTLIVPPGAVGTAGRVVNSVRVDAGPIDPAPSNNKNTHVTIIP